MSRVGKLPIPIPDKVKVAVEGDTVKTTGPGGVLSRSIPSGVTLRITDKECVVERVDDSREARARHGLVRALIGNMVEGVTKGFERKLEIHGVGYRVETKGGFLWFNLGYSHPIAYEIPTGIVAKLEGTTKITLSSIDNEVLGQAAAIIRSFRPPEPYKGKGIRYAGERLLSKEGKAA